MSHAERTAARREFFREMRRKAVRTEAGDATFKRGYLPAIHYSAWPRGCASHRMMDTTDGR